MAFRRSEGGSQADKPNHDENNWIRVAEIQVASAQFLEEKKHADGHDYRGAHKAANGATLA
jgi:hypothetical protein